MLNRFAKKLARHLISHSLDLIYLILLVVAAPYLVYQAMRRGKYRTGWRAKLCGGAPRRTTQGECVWFHAVSVGEVNLLKTVLTRFESAHPDVESVISTTTSTGYELAQRMYAPRLVFYCPLDFSWSVRRALRRVRPTMLVLVELEIWPNLIREAKARGVKVAVVNGRLSERSARGYSRVRNFVRPLFAKLDLVLAQTTTYAQRFLDLGGRPESVQVTGSVKFDGAPSSRENSATQDLRRRAEIVDNDFVFLAGSTQSPEESWAIETYRQLAPSMPHLRLIIVPRHAERFEEVAALLEKSGIAWERRSKWTSSTPRTNELRPRILLVDAIGELGAWWGAADVGFVGGSTGSRGGQNMIEPAAYGVATCFGPKTHNFRDIVELLLTHRAAKVIHTRDDLTAFVKQMAESPEERRELGQRASQVVQRQRGAAEKSVQMLGSLLYSGTSSQRSAA
jgi:3-deoxy-D-manno-octulosonic-acid transferase